MTKNEYLSKVDELLTEVREAKAKGESIDFVAERMEELKTTYEQDQEDARINALKERIEKAKSILDAATKARMERRRTQQELVESAIKGMPNNPNERAAIRGLK